MKVAIVVHDLGKKRGHDRYALELARFLSDHHETHVFACTCEEIDLARIIFHRTPAIGWPDTAKMITFLLSATWALRGHSFDLVHVQGPSSLIGDVFTAHICQARWREEYDRLEHADLSRIRQWYHRVTAWTMGLIESRLYRSHHTRQIIALSHQVKRDLVHYYGCSEEKISVVHNGINLEEFHPRYITQCRLTVREESSIALEAFVLLFVGDYQRKGLRYAIEALGHLSGADIQLVVVGAGSSAPYEKIAEDIGRREAVRFVGPRGDIYRYYAMSDVLVFPTLYEPFGFTITEAMATGIPVITSADAGAAEVIKNGHDGLLLKNPRDPGEIAEQIQCLIDHPDLRLQLGRNARQKVESLAWPLFGQRVEQIYRSVIQGATDDKP